jgi:hypothetical protein
MPDYGSIGEAVVKSWVIRERFVNGFSLWQLILASSLGRTSPYLLAADIIGKMVSDVYTSMPLTLPKKWGYHFDKILDKAREEIDNLEAVEKVKADDPNAKVLRAKKTVDPKVSLQLVNKWSELAEKRQK